VVFIGSGFATGKCNTDTLGHPKRVFVSVVLFCENFSTVVDCHLHAVIVVVMILLPVGYQLTLTNKVTEDLRVSKDSLDDGLFVCCTDRYYIYDVIIIVSLIYSLY